MAPKVDAWKCDDLQEEAAHVCKFGIWLRVSGGKGGGGCERPVTFWESGVDAWKPKRASVVICRVRPLKSE